MIRTYTVRIQDKEYVVRKDSRGGLTVNGTAVEAHFTELPAGRLLRTGSRTFEISAIRPESDENTFRIVVSGQPIVAEVEDEKAALMRSFQSDKSTKLHSALMRSPMPGKITRVLVSEGELIEAGQGVIILEAMKMENEIKAPSAGIVKAIHVKEADAVEKNAILIEIS